MLLAGPYERFAASAPLPGCSEPRGTGGVADARFPAVGLRGEGRLNQHWRVALSKTGAI